MREKTSEDSIYNFITNVCREQERKNGIITGCDTNYIAEGMKLKRSNVSAVLNKLCREEKLIKIKGKPVNCEDYANNPQLLLSYLFGIKRKTALGQFLLVSGL